ncbi:hypothetical protein ACFV0T_09945 [Streptomyces sp. NPDC059582]|uniref:hypothetical protein n=1 Tax=Streptomyces sp. NPDC059582 TaxID=3346875 RepID=UPI00368D2332
MPASEPQVQPAQRVQPGLFMRELLASCAAADVISTPPRAPEAVVPADGHREAA